MQKKVFLNYKVKPHAARCELPYIFFYLITKLESDGTDGNVIEMIFFNDP